MELKNILTSQIQWLIQKDKFLYFFLNFYHFLNSQYNLNHTYLFNDNNLFLSIKQIIIARHIVFNFILIR